MFINYTKGQQAILKLQERCLELGWSVCIPTVEERFDVVLVDCSGKCHKVQVKYAGQSENDGSILVDFRKQTRNNGNTKVYTSGEIAAIVVYLGLIGKLVWLGPEKFNGRKTMTMRFSPSKNNQSKSVNLVDDLIW